MRINSFKFDNFQEGWGFDKIHFSELTLLVGISGAGKTQILKALLHLTNAVLGDASNSNATQSIAWEIDFTAKNNDAYIWKGELERNDKNIDFFTFDMHLYGSAKPSFVFEQLFQNGNLIVDRTIEKTIYLGNKLPKLDSYESILKILKEDNIINAFAEFGKILFRDHTEKDREWQYMQYTDYEKLKSKYNTLEKLKSSALNVVTKLAMLPEINYTIFQEIQTRFCDIFTQVEYIKIEINEQTLPQFEILLKVKNSDNWVGESSISSGMMRTLIHIAEMYLCEDGTVFLIDEFENSLGVNCVNILSEDLLLENNRMQFIITSHHPYIINKIPCEYWKIVTRNGGRIKVYDSSDFDLGSSPHENFFKLINLQQYKNGIEL